MNTINLRILRDIELQHPYMGELVKSDVLSYEFVYGKTPDVTLVTAFYGDIMRLERMHGVTFDVISDDFENDHYANVTVSGPYENVIACIVAVWGMSGDNDATFAHMMIGDEDAKARWDGDREENEQATLSGDGWVIMQIWPDGTGTCLNSAVSTKDRAYALLLHEMRDRSNGDGTYGGNLEFHSDEPHFVLTDGTLIRAVEMPFTYTRHNRED